MINWQPIYEFIPPTDRSTLYLCHHPRWDFPRVLIWKTNDTLGKSYLGTPPIFDKYGNIEDVDDLDLTIPERMPTYFAEITDPHNKEPQMTTTNLPGPIAVTLEEGGDWISWYDHATGRVPSPAGKQLHAIKFDNGYIFCAHTGWRRNPK